MEIEPFTFSFRLSYATLFLVLTSVYEKFDPTFHYARAAVSNYGWHHQSQLKHSSITSIQSAVL